MTQSNAPAAPIGRPLAGLRVVEAGIALSGPFCASLLADFGASVIKVERRDGGDPARLLGPQVDHVSLWWGVMARDKQCATLDLKAEADRGRFLKLVAEADVLVENYRPGVMERLGLGWDTLSACNPGLIVMSISGFGQTGPDAKRPGFGKIAEGLSGIVPLTGRPGDAPLHVGFSLADTSAGLMGCMAINMALLDRERNGGRGARIDVALYEPLLRMAELQLALRESAGVTPQRSGSNDPYCWGADPQWGANNEYGRRYVAAACRDGHKILVRVDAASAAAVAALAGAVPGSVAATLDAALRAWAGTQEVEAAGALLRAQGIEAARIHDGLSLARSKYFLARGDVQTTSDPVSGALAVPGQLPLRAPRSGLTAFHAAQVGEHNAAVFGGEVHPAAAGRQRSDPAGSAAETLPRVEPSQIR